MKIPLELMSETFWSKSERTSIIILLGLKGRRAENEKAGESAVKVAGKYKDEAAAAIFREKETNSECVCVSIKLEGVEGRRNKRELKEGIKESENKKILRTQIFVDDKSWVFWTEAVET